LYVTCYLKLNIVLSENRIRMDHLPKMTELTLEKLIPIAGEIELDDDITLDNIQ